MTMPGAPCIYYGDEVGMSSAQDPFCRAAFPWHDERQWDLDLLAFFRRAIALRQRHPVLRTGALQPLYARGGVYAFARILDRQWAVVILNTQTTAMTINIELTDSSREGQVFVGVWNSGRYVVSRQALQRVTVPARDGLILISNETDTERAQ
jgi:cyclomaltodextrinase / maltogenic alpha-amylase / neopullulanase